MTRMSMSICQIVKMAGEARPNIRIEIQNNFVESMEVDEVVNPKESEGEDGEISDLNENEETNVSKESETRDSNVNRPWPNANGGFTTGVDIFDKKEQEKLIERAKRFGLRADEINNFTDEHLQELHDSLGITAEGEKEVRFEALHMRGTDNMSTEDIFEYFEKYGPAFIEWINDESCNVVWNDKVSAARALHFISKRVEGMPSEGPCNPFVNELNSDKEKEDSDAGRSVLLKNVNREVEMQEDAPDENKENREETTVHISDITIPVPPGFWRLGLSNPKSRFILLRFALKSDKKPMRAERFSEYYKKYGNPNYGGIKGIITDSLRMKFKGVFERNKDLRKQTESEDVGDSSKNPWGSLAQEWNNEAEPVEQERVELAVDSPPRREVNNSTAEKGSIMSRLGFKRSHNSDVESEEEEPEEKKKTKIPRMRMYADEEEEKIKRKKKLLEVKLHQRAGPEETISANDLRNFIETNVKKNVTQNKSDMLDLGSKLKNRRERERSKNVTQRLGRKEETYDSVSVHEDLGSKSVLTTNKKEKVKRQDLEKRRYREKLYSDRTEHKKHRSYADDERVDHNKTRSKVAVVIKTQKKPAVASTIWSRINADKERLKTSSERLKFDSKLSSSNDSSSESGSSGSSSDSSSSDSSESEVVDAKQIDVHKKNLELIKRPGFKTELKARLGISKDHRSPLRIEINNDHFKKSE